MNPPPQITLQDLLADIHALQEDLEMYERKYGLLSETVYEWYMAGEEPENDDWVLDWGDWASCYQLLLQRQELYRYTIKGLLQQAHTVGQIAQKTARHEPIPIAS